MKITQIEIFKSPVKLKEPFITSLGALTHAENLIVIIRTDTGISGMGECSPFLTINGESMETGFIVGQYLGKALSGKNPLNIQECSLAMDAVIYGNSSIKSAFDMALFDIGAQNEDLPLYRFLSGNNNKVLRTDYTVSLKEPDKMAKDAIRIKEMGFQIIKVKLGENKERDLERIRLIREAVGYDLSLRIDANQGWSTDTAIETLDCLAPFNIQYCEEPIPRWNFMELPMVKKQSPIPIMADECCCDHHDAQRLIELNACDLFNIKLGKSSGIFKAQKIIGLAEKHGIKMQIGGFLESRLGFTAAAHLALTSADILYCDFDTPLMLVEDPIMGGISYGKNGLITVPDMPGLGATLNADYLRGLAKAVIS